MPQKVRVGSEQSGGEKNRRTNHRGELPIRESAEQCSPKAVAAFETRINTDPCTLTDRLWVKDQLDPKEEEVRFPK
jgi:hypothetical protein